MTRDAFRASKTYALGLLMVAAAGLAPLAEANGDPASDVLYTADVYLPYASPSASAAKALNRAVESAYGRHFRVKVAVIAGQADVGTVSALWGKPLEYAKFLGIELDAFYVGPLLIVMPAGFGIYDGGRSVVAEQRVLASTNLRGTDPESLTLTAADAIARLLKTGALRSRDIRAPFANAYSATVHRGGVARLRFGVSDDSKWSKIKARVLVKSRVFARFKTPLLRLSRTHPVTLRWNVPRKLPAHGVRLCVIASDGAGNRSLENCGGVTVA